MKKIILPILLLILPHLVFAGEWFTNEKGITLWVWNPDTLKVKKIEGKGKGNHGLLDGRAKITWENKSTGIVFEREYYFASGVSDFNDISDLYIDDDAPSDDDIMHSYKSRSESYKFDGTYIIKIHGRAGNEEAQNIYATIGKYDLREEEKFGFTPDSTGLEVLHLIHLDSDMWVLSSGFGTHPTLVRKAE